jgi:predicted ABC-type ATPase
VTPEAAVPRLLVVAGPNGSGKTTLTTRLREFGLDFGEYINADEIALTMPPTAERDRLAQIASDERRRGLLDARQTFSFETVLSHPSKIDEMREAKSLGYHFTFYFVAVSDPEINVQRVRHRVAIGGHDVPSDRIIARYFRTMELMPQAILLADQSFIFDNSDVSNGPELMAEFHAVPVGLEATIVRGLPYDEIDAEELYGSRSDWVSKYVFSGVRREAMRLGVKTNLP